MDSTSQYLQYAWSGLGYVALTLWPILYAAIVASFPSKLSKRFRFALICGAVSNGASILVAAALKPIQMIAILTPWEDAGFAYLMFPYGLPFIAGLAVAIWLPIHLRKRVWSKIYSPDSS